MNKNKGRLVKWRVNQIPGKKNAGTQVQERRSAKNIDWFFPLHRIVENEDRKKMGFPLL